jgi:hypothetical protein
MDREAAGTIAALFVDLGDKTQPDSRPAAPEGAVSESVSADDQNGQPDDL